MTGIVKWFNNDKGYGFISFDDKEVFVHYSQIVDTGFKTLIPGSEVKFELLDTTKGFQAKSVKIIPASA
jgi:CspA family cold shock protein